MNTEVSDGIFHTVPDDIRNALSTNPETADKWNGLTPIQRNEWICWVTIAKKSESRTARLARLLQDLSAGKRQPCCWPGCPHRKPAAQKWFKNLDE